MDILIDVIVLIAVFALGFWRGWDMAGRFHTQAVHNIFRKLNITEDQLRDVHHKVRQELLEELEDQEEFLEIKVEMHAGQLFAYRKNDGLFLAQAVDGDSLIGLLKGKFKDCRVTIRPEDGAEHIVASI